MMYHNVTRKRPPTEEPELKERVIHTRVPESLEDELRRRGQDLGMPVSNLVGNVLGHAFGLVGDVVADSYAIARSAKGERMVARDEVVAWQAIVLAKNAVCAHCNAVLSKGAPAGRGVTEDGAPGQIVCTACMEGDSA